MIRFSALLVALAIGLLVAGVAASSLPLVYVSIAVCAVAALLLAAGVLRHWSEIFGNGTKRAAASPFAASRPVPSPARAGRAAVGPAATGPVARPGLAGFRTNTGAAPAGPVSRRSAEPAVAGGRVPAGPDQAVPAASVRPGQDEVDQASRGDRRPSRKGRPSRRPAEPEPAVAAAAEPVHAAPTDDLWERVNEELESGGKRDSGRLSWPAGDFSIPSGMSLPTEPAETLSGLGPAGGGDLWPPAAGWQPPTTPHGNWPFAPPAERDSAGPADQDVDHEVPEPELAAQPAAEPPVAGRAEPSEATPSVPAWDAPTRAEAGRSAPAQDEATPDDAADGGGAADEAEPVDDSAASAWTIRPQPGPGAGSTVVSTPPVLTPPAGPAEPSRPAEPAEATAEAAGPGQAAAEAAGPGQAAAEAAEAPDSAGAAGPAEATEAAETSESSEAGEPDQAAEPARSAEAAKPPEAGHPAKTGGTGQVQVTVVPGVARYHRGECILIRFLGEDDLELMAKQEAVSAGLAACRACQPDQLPGD